MQPWVGSSVWDNPENNLSVAFVLSPCKGHTDGARADLIWTPVLCCHLGPWGSVVLTTLQTLRAPTSMLALDDGYQRDTLKIFVIKKNKTQQLHFVKMLPKEIHQALQLK